MARRNNDDNDNEDDDDNDDGDDDDNDDDDDDNSLQRRCRRNTSRPTYSNVEGRNIGKLFPTSLKHVLRNVKERFRYRIGKGDSGCHPLRGRILINSQGGCQK